MPQVSESAALNSPPWLNSPVEAAWVSAVPCLLVHSRAKAVVDAYTFALRELGPAVVGVGLGGSLGRDEGDELSDIDMFVLISPDADFFRVLAEVGHRLRHPVSVLASSDITYKDGLGFRQCFLREDGLQISIFFNTTSSLIRNTMRWSTRVFWDLSGMYAVNVPDRETVAEAEFQSRLSIGLGDIVTEIPTLSRHAVRGDWIAFYNRFARFRLSVIGMLRSLSHGTPYFANGADKGLPRVLEADVMRQLLRTFPKSPAPVDLELAVKEIRPFVRQILDQCESSEAIANLTTSGLSQLIQHLSDQDPPQRRSKVRQVNLMKRAVGSKFQDRSESVPHQ